MLQIPPSKFGYSKFASKWEGPYKLINGNETDFDLVDPDDPSIYYGRVNVARLKIYIPSELPISNTRAQSLDDQNPIYDIDPKVARTITADPTPLSF